MYGHEIHGTGLVWLLRFVEFIQRGSEHTEQFLSLTHVKAKKFLQVFAYKRLASKLQSEMICDPETKGDWEMCTCAKYYEHRQDSMKFIFPTRPCNISVLHTTTWLHGGTQGSAAVGESRTNGALALRLSRLISSGSIHAVLTHLGAVRLWQEFD